MPDLLSLLNRYFVDECGFFVTLGHRIRSLYVGAVSVKVWVDCSGVTVRLWDCGTLIGSFEACDPDFLEKVASIVRSNQ